MAPRSAIAATFPYPERFQAAAAYAGIGRDPNSASTAAIARLPDDARLKLQWLYHQAKFGPYAAQKPNTRKPAEESEWTSGDQPEKMLSAEAMRLFVEVLEANDPEWYFKVPESIIKPLLDALVNKKTLDPAESYTLTGISIQEPETIAAQNENLLETKDEDAIKEGFDSVKIFDTWTVLSTSGRKPKPRYKHGATILQDKMYIFGGCYSGRYLSNLQVLDLKSLTWSEIEAKTQSPGSATTVPVAPCAGHSLITWGRKILSIGGHSKDYSDTVTVKEFDPQTCTWANIKTCGKPPISRSGQSVTLIGTTLVMFGGEDVKRTPMNDVHILDLETMTWDEINTIGTPPFPRSDHTAACHCERYLLIFGGGSRSTCFNDLHVLDLETRKWSIPKQVGITPSPRTGHAGVRIGEYWFIVGGGNNNDGVSETLCFDMSNLAWSVVTTVQGRMPLASEGLSIVFTTYKGKEFLVSFGGYSGNYSNEVHVLKASYKSDIPPPITNGIISSTALTMYNSPNGSILNSEIKHDQDRKVEQTTTDKVHLSIPNITQKESSGVIGAVKTDIDGLKVALKTEQLLTRQLQQALALTHRTIANLTEELKVVVDGLAPERSRLFELEANVAELQQKLQPMEGFQKAVEFLRQKKAA
ncbi:acyl-CoA-binding domain-containing protein 4-like [Ananas comosus]|uniref:Acyl-CoA-binding domain-containing protein 4-like n=1 Tax=Ananas comosus TaxID=4615 RepID=A0A6P5FZS9_ANACO|nr:acyl-CoA-binding domain-containing protein 4-like [Ananas comosus]